MGITYFFYLFVMEKNILLAAVCLFFEMKEEETERDLVCQNMKNENKRVMNFKNQSSNRNNSFAESPWIRFILKYAKECLF